MAAGKSKIPADSKSQLSELPADKLRDELLSIAYRITNPPPNRSEDDDSELVGRWNELCPHPGGSDILFWPNAVGLCADHGRESDKDVVGPNNAKLIVRTKAGRDSSQTPSFQ